MKRCPKCKTPNPLNAKECDGCGVIFADIRSVEKAAASLTCPWNDHGAICGKPGSISDGQNGSGAWYCSEHYWRMRKFPIRAYSNSRVSFRERWYAENRMQYEPANLNPCINFRCVGRLSSQHAREPGDDDEEIAA